MQGLNELKGFLFEGAAEPAAIIVYSPKITRRLKYVCKFIFNQALLCNFILTDNENEFNSSRLARINYSDKIFEGSLTVSPNGLLENGVMHQPQLDCRSKDFDLFSAVFYYTALIREWLSGTKDEHGRILGVAEQEPLVDMWISDFKDKLLEQFKTLSFPKRQFKFISTIDVDNVFAYKAKPLYRQIGGILKDIKHVFPRLGTILFGKKDPFDEYELQTVLSKKYSIPLIYFFLYRNNTKYDRTIHPGHPEFIKLLRYLKDRGITFGLHPSYDTSVDTKLLQKEINLLSKNSGKKIICSRQHFLRFNIKTTPKELMEAGIRYDFTMGMADKAGFRAGTSLPFYYYDISSESELNLMAVPFVVMDGAYYVYNKLEASVAYDQIMELAAKVKKVDGLFITVIHERSFSETVAPGWKTLYVKLHEALKNS